MTPDQMGISGGGRDAEERFFKLTGAERAPKAALGDAVIDGNLVEVKRATSTTLNQVRAVKFIVLVAYYCPDGADPCWYVVPAHQVVALVARKPRGQHTENPFESATLNTRDLADYRVDDEAQLREQVLAAVRDGARYGDLQAEMARVLNESRLLASDSRERVAAVLRRHGLA
ncbi:MAG TPA: hypothetical protein VIC06_06920 [Solirubrobacteraceae bacterium]